jgi:opacity protein-like surface antigen
MLCVFAAHAESNRFIGGNIQIATGYQLNTPTLDNYSEKTISTSNSNINAIPLVLGLGYSLSLNNSKIIGLSYERNLVDTNSASLSTTSSTATTGSSMAYTNQQRFSLIGGHLLNSYAMVYGKLGYASLTTTKADNNFDLSGYVIGAGYKSFLNNYQYVFAEYNHTRMPKASLTVGTYTLDAKSVGHEFLIGVGLQF